MKFSETVAKGAALLDRDYPEWRYEISVDSLSMRSCGWCVLGQLYGHFWEGIWKVFEKETHEASWDEAMKHGFCYPDNTVDEEIDALQAEWIEQIKKGRAE